MKQLTSSILISFQLVILLVGTQMPGAWRVEGLQLLHAPTYVSSLAHFVLFAGLALVMAVRPVSWSGSRILWAALALALLTEAFQYFAIDRHPRLRDVGIDLAGTVAGLLFAKLGSVFASSRLGGLTFGSLKRSWFFSKPEVSADKKIAVSD